MADSADDPSTPAGSPPLQGERVALTGTLASMTHRQALELVEKHGGTPMPHVSRQTTMLVIGEEGWPLEPDGKPSQKLLQAQEWIERGVPLRVLSEAEWLHLIGLGERCTEIKRLYTPAMLSRLLDIPVNTIRGWERAGLISPVKRVYRLPYFDFQEVTAARRLTELIASGVPRREIEASLSHLKNLLPGIERPLAQLEVLARDTRLLYRDKAGLVDPRTAQRLFDFGSPGERAGEQRKSGEDTSSEAAGNPGDDGQTSNVAVRFSSEVPARRDPRLGWTADEWFHEGCRLLDEDEPGGAVEAFRLALMDRPGDAEMSFHLAETLYRLGNRDGALERYYAAVESDHQYIEVWTQIGCLHLEKGDAESAVQALDVALDIHPDYPDAHLHKAEALDQLGRRDEAADHWRAYLQHDTRGPWADKARQRLESSRDG